MSLRDPHIRKLFWVLMGILGFLLLVIIYPQIFFWLLGFAFLALIWNDTFGSS